MQTNASRPVSNGLEPIADEETGAASLLRMDRAPMMFAQGCPNNISTRLSAFCLTMCTLPFGCNTGQDVSLVYQARLDIKDILMQQEAAWNAGDLEGFMEPYLRSRSLTFSSGGHVTRGWEDTLKRYQERYPTVERMGKLKLDRIEIDVLNEKAAFVLGRWYLRREDGPASGAFTLVFRKKHNKWVIIHDHTSADADNAEVPE